MKLNEQEIENLLRRAPKPKTPATLRSRLVAQIRLAGATHDSQPTAGAAGFGGWLRRWWPALAPASVSLACAAMMVSQEVEIRGLQRNTRYRAEQRASLQTAAATAAKVSAQSEVEAAALAAEQQEIARLKERAGQLGTEVARLEKLQAENESLRKQSVASTGLTTDELALLADARERAMAINCVNNLKQIGLASKLWALDNNDTLAPSFLSMSNELNTPKILVCSADTNRVAATTFTAYTDANCTYELLAPSGSDLEPTRVLTRCPVHGHVGLCDGSVQSDAWKQHPEWFAQRDNKLYFERPAQRQSEPVRTPKP